MKSLFIIVGFLAFAAVPAQAKLAPVIEPEKPAAIAVDHATLTLEPVGAQLESDYFTAPQAPFAAGRVFPCRMQVRLFDKTRLAQSC